MENCLSGKEFGLFLSQRILEMVLIILIGKRIASLYMESCATACGFCYPSSKMTSFLRMVRDVCQVTATLDPHTM
jgi:hypothetical protein